MSVHNHSDYDLIIVGTGAGGGTLAYALRHSGAAHPADRARRLSAAGAGKLGSRRLSSTRSATSRTRCWYDADGRPFKPGVHYFVGGNTKVYGAALPVCAGKISARSNTRVARRRPGRLAYDDLEPYYCQAEEIYLVHGHGGEDPTEPPRSRAYPFPAVPHEPYIEALAGQLRQQGLHPFLMPMGLDLRDDGALHPLQDLRRFSLPGAGQE